MTFVEQLEAWADRAGLCGGPDVTLEVVFRDGSFVRAFVHEGPIRPAELDRRCDVVKPRAASVPAPPARHP